MIKAEIGKQRPEGKANSGKQVTVRKELWRTGIPVGRSKDLAPGESVDVTELNFRARKTRRFLPARLRSQVSVDTNGDLRVKYGHPNHSGAPVGLISNDGLEELASRGGLKLRKNPLIGLSFGVREVK